MSDILDSIAKRLKFKEVSLDNWVFKLFSIGSVTLCLAGSLLVAATQYFGSPITCEFDASVSGDLAEKYCWIHGSNWIRKEYQDDFDCAVSQNNISSTIDAPDTSYYQWVVFFLAVQAGLFMLPYKIWKASDRGLIKGFSTEETRSVFLLSNDEKTRDLVKLYIKQFNCILHHNTRYFVTFVACEIFNVIFLVFNFYLTNVFLNGKFNSYGLDVLDYYNTDPHARVYNPMCEAFPTKVSCSLKIVAEGGGVNVKNGFCILSQNIVNEKIFLILYFWYIALFIISGFFMVYRACTIFVPQVQVKLISHRIRGGNLDGSIKRILSQCQIGDWFVLSQIGKNVNPYFFRTFLQALQHEIGRQKDDGIHLKAFGENDCLLRMENEKETTEEAVPMEMMTQK